MADQVRRVPVRMALKFRMVPLQIADKVAELSGAHSRQSSGGFRCRCHEVSNGQVLEGSGWLIKFGGSRCRWPMKFRMVPVQIADKVAELSGAHSRQSSGGLWYKNRPRSSKLLGITHEFILFLSYSKRSAQHICSS